MKNILLFFFILFFLGHYSISYAETNSILITVSDSMSNVQFDGKWSFFSEWKASSVDSISDKVIIRSAHQENFVYIFLDVVHDTSPESRLDRAMICFAPENSKSLIPNSNDYCFISILDESHGYTMQGNPQSTTKNYYEKITNHDDFIGIGRVSDNNDRYSNIPHPSYEFKIPTDLITRSNNYGFYIETFDATSQKTLTWPMNITQDNDTDIPSPKVWGDLISPDKSLPEFPFPTILLITVLLTMIIVLRNLNHGRLRINIQ